MQHPASIPNWTHSAGEEQREGIGMHLGCQGASLHPARPRHCLQDLTKVGGLVPRLDRCVWVPLLLVPDLEPGLDVNMCWGTRGVARGCWVLDRGMRRDRPSLSHPWTVWVPPEAARPSSHKLVSYTGWRDDSAWHSRTPPSHTAYQHGSAGSRTRGHPFRAGSGPAGGQPPPRHSPLHIGCGVSG